MTLQLLWEEYRQGARRSRRTATASSASIYRRWARKLKPSMRQVHRAGEKTFIDFSGKRPHFVDPKTGEVITVELFVGALGASSYTYAEATLTQKLHDWIGGARPDAGVLRGLHRPLGPGPAQERGLAACRYEPEVNRSYQELAPPLRGGGDPGPARQGERQGAGSSRWCWSRSAGSWPGCATAPSSSLAS